MEPIYRHTQISYLTLIVLTMAGAAAVSWAIWTAHPVVIAAAVLIASLLLAFSTLTVVVGEEALHVRFGPGPIQRRIPLTRIRDARPVTTPWYYGWGIRITPHGWLWNVSGTQGVELLLDNGRRFRIGSDEPGKLAEVLRQQTR